MSVDFTAYIFFGRPISYEKYNKLTDEEKEEYVYRADCYHDGKDTTFILGVPVLSCDPGQVKNVAGAGTRCDDDDRTNIYYICNKYNIDTELIGYYLVHRVS